MNELDFNGRQVLVVGGSSGIGNGIAQAFRAKGARVAVCGTRAGAADYAADEGSHLEGLDYHQLDVSDPQAVEKFKPSFATLDVMVLAQGAVIYRRGEFAMDGFRKVLEVNLMSLMACATRFHEMLKQAKGSLIIVSSTAAYHSTMGNPAYNASKTGAVGLTRTLGEAWARGLAVMLTAHQRIIRAALPYLRQSKCPRIVNIASTEALGATALHSPYSAAKAGVTGLTRSLAVELGRDGITVNCICPGPIRTAITDRIPEEHKIIYAKRRTALGRYGVPEEVAHMTLSLCLPAASFLTGAVIPVDGGLMARNA